MDSKRCEWTGNDELYINYHDNEWGKPVHDDRQLFEMLSLEGAQAGLSWITVLRKREAYRLAFANFDPHIVSLFTDSDVEELLENKGIVRHRGKIKSVIENAKLFIDIAKEYGSFDYYLWSFVGFVPILGNHNSIYDVPTTTPLADKISKDLRKRGFKFVGPTIIYSFLQAAGVVNDHIKSCVAR